MGEKILIVEDDKTFLEAMKFKLEDQGYRVEQAEDAWEALRIVEHNKIDLIISDILMPTISGLGLLNILNEFYFDKVPVILISSLNKEIVVPQTIGLGAYDFMKKPVNFDELHAKISRLLNKNSEQNHPKNKKT